jgi:hypothetical protein
MTWGIGGGHSSWGMRLNELLGVIGLHGQGLGIALDSLTGDQAGVLQNLYDQALSTAMGRNTSLFEKMMIAQQGGMFPPFLGIPSPMSMYPMMSALSGSGYAGGIQRIDLSPGSTNIPFFSQMFDPQRRMAAMFERQLQTNPYARAAFEAQIGGRIIGDFRNDGVITVQRFAPGFAPVPGMAFNPLANTAVGYMSSMNGAVLQQAAGMGWGNAPYALGGLYGGNPFPAFLMSGLGGMMPNGPAFGASGTVGIGSPSAWGFNALQGPLGGQGVGSWNPLAQPGRINNTNPLYERAHQAEIDSVLRDPSLTVEDKVTLMIMLIMKKMDEDIERQAQYINAIQQQQSNRGQTGETGGTGGKFGKGGSPATGGLVGGQGGGLDNQSSPSIDVETMKLKRMIDKRSQMFDMLRQIIDKYNQTAKGIIDSIGR